MIIIQGTGVSGGLTFGTLAFYAQTARTIPLSHADPAAEKVRLAQARRDCVSQLEQLAEACLPHNPDGCALFETHAMLAEDEDLVACTEESLETLSCSAEYAVQQAGEQFAALFEQMDDPYMRLRADDVRDITRRLICCLTGDTPGEITFDSPVILCADDLSPSQTIGLDRSKILALATRNGSENSHTAILARTMGIPAVCALGQELDAALEGHPCWLDGDTGRLILHPDGDTLARLEKALAQQQAKKQQLAALKDTQDTTADGRSIALYCNIASPADIPAVLSCGGRGIGLYRSEFLFLGRDTPPGEEEQFEAYRTVLSAMGEKPVVIRTMDIGSDKQAGWLDLKPEANPALGMRGVRLCLARPELFKVQLRALCRAAVYGNLSVMFPMITSPEEVRRCKALFQEVTDELSRSGIPCGSAVRLGIMIETPAAVLCADELAKQADFFCVGTNDLTQYTLACDRQSGIGSTFDPRHPAVLRAVRMAAQAAQAAGIPIGICGELAAEVDMLSDFLDMGITELSMSPAAVLPLRAALQKIGVNP